MSDEVEKVEKSESAFFRSDEVSVDIALARLITISPLLHTGLSQSARYRLIVSIAEKGWEHPFLGWLPISYRTINRWLCDWKEKNLDGLRPRYRRDRGLMKALPPDLFAKAISLKEELPSRTVKRVIELLELREDVVPHTIARSTLQRHLQRRGLTGRKIPLLQESVSRFEAKSPGNVWQTDEKFGPYIIQQGISLRTRIFGFLDDHSRLCTGIEAFVDGKGINLHHCLRRALEIWHCPTLIYADNGKVYVSRQLRQLCAELGICLTHAKPYRAQSKGKIERFWGTLNSFIVEANAARYTSLKELNDALQGWVELKYNKQAHSALSDLKTPLEIYSQALDTIPAASAEDLDRAFRRLETRRVHKDGTFSLDGLLFQVSHSLAGHTIELRVNNEDKTDVWVYRGKKRLMRAKQFDPPDKLPSRSPEVKKGVKTALQSSRAYLASVACEYHHQKEEVITTDIFTMEIFLDTLCVPEPSLSKEDKRAIAGIFDTFGPFDRQEAIIILQKVIEQWGKNRHTTVYLRAIVEKQFHNKS